MAGMKLMDINPPAGKAAALLLAIAGAAGFVGPSLAQQPQLPPPTFATTRSNAAMMLDAGGSKYVDLGAPTSQSFVLERRGSVVLLQQEGSKEILSLMPVLGQRGDTFFMDYTGRTVLKVTKAGNVVSYLHNPAGAPADPAGRVPPLSSPAMTASLDSMRANAAHELSKLAGHDIAIWGTQAFSNDEAWAADALSILVLGVKNANGSAGRVASKVEKVTVRRAKAPKVTFKDGELIVEVNPDDSWAGRVTPEEVARVLTASRSAG
jgi:hypothetical protein